MNCLGKWIPGLTLAFASVVACYCLQTSEPAKGPMRYDVEPLQNRLMLAGGIQRAHWFAQRRYADGWGPPVQDNPLIVRGVMAAQAAEAMFTAATDCREVKVSFADELLHEVALESPALLAALNEQLARVQQKVWPDSVLRFAWCPGKKLIYLELEVL